LDLRKAYLQVRIDNRLWKHQAIKWKGITFLLTRLGFGLCSAPKIMTRIVEFIIKTEPRLKNAVSSYIDDLFINEAMVKAEEVSGIFADWGLITKAPERLGESNPVRVLGIRVNRDFSWERDGKINELNEEPITRRKIHSFVGETVSHFPVAGKARIMCSMLQRMTASEHVSWDDTVSEKILRAYKIVKDYISEKGDPCNGKWLVDKEEKMNIWTDASSIAIGVALEVDGNIVEDGSWLRPKNDSSHINRVELDAAIKGLNLAVKWGKRKFNLKVDSKAVFGWLKSVIDKTHNVKTHALYELVIRRRLDYVSELIEQENLNLSVELVTSAKNIADSLTRLPSNWPIENPVNILTDVVDIHNRAHLGIERTMQLCEEKLGSQVSRSIVENVVKNCEKCSRFDPSVNFRWERGHITSNEVWQFVATDITHVNSVPFLTTIDIYTGFTIWKRMRNESANEVSMYWSQIIAEYGPPEKILSDNGSVFRSRHMTDLCRNWEVDQIFSAAYRPKGNGVIERVHRTIKRSVGRTKRSVEEAVFWYNNTSGKVGISPYELMFGYKSRKPNVSKCRLRAEKVPSRNTDVDNDYSDVEKNPFVVGDKVYLKPSNSRCDVEWSGPHVVTKLLSRVSCEINDDGIARHVSHLRLVPGSLRDEGNREMEIDISAGSSADLRPQRDKKAPFWHKDYVFY